MNLKENAGPIGIGVAVVVAIVLLIILYRANFASNGPPPNAADKPAYANRGSNAPAPYGPTNHPGMSTGR